MSNGLDIRDFPGWRSGWLKPWTRSIWEWAQEYVSLPDNYAVPGKFSIASSRWMIPILDAIQSMRTKQVTWQAPTQGGKTLICDITIPYLIANDPGPIMWVQQTDDDAKTHAKTRLMPLLRRCGPVAGLLPQSKGDMTTTDIFFPHMFMMLCGANENNLQSKSIRYLICSELHVKQWQGLYPQAEARVGYYRKMGTHKILVESQPGTENDEMDQRYQSGTREVMEVDCGGGYAPLVWRGKHDDGTRYGVVWADDCRREDGTWDVARMIETVRYRCPVSGIELPDTDATRARWNHNLRYTQTNPDGTEANRSFSVSGVAWRTMRELVIKWVEAWRMMQYGSDRQMKDFMNKEVGEVWKERRGDSITITGSDYSVREYSDGQKDDDEQERIIAVDKQKDHYWVLITSVKDSGCVKQLYFGRVETSIQIEYLREKYKVSPMRVVIDSQYDQSSVYDDCQRYGWVAINGTRPKTFAIRDGRGNVVKSFVSEVENILHKGGTLLKFSFSADDIKDILSNRINNPFQWQIPADVNPEYIEHCKAERKAEERPGVWTWVNKPKRPNHGWDCSTMTLAATILLGLIRADPETRSTE
jgi:phage terminase large subunit GpA-like protein